VSEPPDLFSEGVEARRDLPNQAALRYARHGLRVFPVDMRLDEAGQHRKTPPHGYLWKERATTSVNEVVEDFTNAEHDLGAAWVGVGWALGLDGMLALDLDGPEPPWWSELGEAIVNPTKRGEHRIVPMPDGRRIGNSTARFPTQGWGEVRGHGGYIVIWGPDRAGLSLEEVARVPPPPPRRVPLSAARWVPPFSHPEWLSDASPEADAVTWTELEVFKANHAGGQLERVKGFETRLAQLPPGASRHDHAVSMACWMAREAAAGLVPALAAFEALEAWWGDVGRDEGKRRRLTRRELMSIERWAVGQLTPERVDEVQAKAAAEEAQHRLRQEVLNSLVTSSKSSTSSSGKQEATWPSLAPAALMGLPGEVVRLLAPHTEADPVAVLLSFLVAFGNVAGLNPYMEADGAKHRANLFSVLVGRTAKARKGTAWSRVNPLLLVMDQIWGRDRIKGGLSSGEGVISAVGDAVVNKKGEEVAAAKDKRLLVIEEEFSKVLTVAHREGNTLSEVLRQAWDGRDLSTMTKVPAEARQPHISVIGHVTLEELRAKLTVTEQLNGFANRFLFALVRRSQVIADGGNPEPSAVASLFNRVEAAKVAAIKLQRVTRTTAAQELWVALYDEMARDDEVGMVGAAAARVEAQTLRLSLVYALACGAPLVDVGHLEAAWALWRYCRSSLEYLFGDSIGDEVADQLLMALIEAHPEGLDRTAQFNLFGRNLSASRLSVARELLIRLGHAVERQEQTGGPGRPRISLFHLHEQNGSDE
jgi:hypothetical protein